MVAASFFYFKLIDTCAYGIFVRWVLKLKVNQMVESNLIFFLYPSDERDRAEAMRGGR